MPNLDVWRVVVDERHEAADHEARHRADRLGHGRGHHGLHHQWRVAGDVPVITHLQVRACLHTHTRARAPFPSLPGNSSPLTRGLMHASHLSYHNIMPEVTPATFVSPGDNSSLKPQPTVFYTHPHTYVYLPNRAWCSPI